MALKLKMIFPDYPKAIKMNHAVKNPVLVFNVHCEVSKN